MSTANPFQIPSCLQRADLQRRRQERFQKIVVATVVAGASLMIALLIAGCVNQQSKAAASAKLPGTQSEPVAVAVAAPKPAPTLSLKSNVSASSVAVPVAPAVVKPSAPATSPGVLVPALYVVKSGDTLTLIARQHGTTIKEIKQLNGLASDKIVVGTKLKVPSVQG